MDYKKAYHRARMIAESRMRVEENESVVTFIGLMFPELKEDEYEKMRQEAIHQVRYALCEQEGSYSDDDPVIAWLKSLRPQSKQEWSEEDEIRRERCMLYLANMRDCIESSQFIGDNAKESSKKEIQKDIAWLKSLRPQPKWKPSDEQLNELRYALLPGYRYNCDVLQGLYADLNKLMED